MNQKETASPFLDIRRMITSIPGPDGDSQSKARSKESKISRQKGRLGRLDWLAEWMSAWQHHYPPSMTRPLVCVFAGSQGIDQYDLNGSSPSGKVMLDAYSDSNSAVTQICGDFGFGFRVFDLAMDVPTEDFSINAALNEKACVATMAYGMEAVAGEIDVLALGSTGGGNLLSAAAIFAALYGGGAEKWLIRENGADAQIIEKRLDLINKALTLHKDSFSDPLEILRRLGSREIAAIAGAILAARLQKIPVILDGYVCSAAAAILYAIHPATLDHCIAGHLYGTGAHQEILEKIHKIPLLAMGIEADDGIGAALALAMVKASLAAHNGMDEVMLSS